MEPKAMEGDKASDVEVAHQSPLRFSDLLLRLIALLTSTAAVVIMATATEIKTVPITIVPTLPPLPVALAAKWHHLSAFTYFVVSHAITCVYLSISLTLLIVNRASNAKKLVLIQTITDVMMMGLLFSGNSAAVAVELIGLHGNSHLKWNKVCNVFKGYCHQVGAASMVSLISSFLLLFMVILTIVNLHKKCKSM